ncbi:Zinc-type alcohol dehydrogenase-like protein [Cyphellophora attinorum]|uniref:Zinc-type alcohol dehydrogenase-like protein n=1 Tax=Cyphellophora attinorum TaxID=1664694 RepID=A0A0N1H331_9EURO|nr:Zinc-type alcohol dehydrogenase-like protein [Phialophora attinorum]KPI34690.1 Zinc-type alcohol dehydrogenase-like protein [Phialophora attinorum]
MVTAKQQKAVLVTEIGKPVELGTRDIPTPGEGQVLVKVTATMILPHDTYGRDWGLLVEDRLPAVLGNNVAGVIDEVGPGVGFKVGERIFGISGNVAASSDQAGLQEYAILNADAIAHIPEGFSDAAVASLPINLVTSAAVLFTKTGFDMPAPYLPRKDFDCATASVVIVGGGTNVGQLAVQLASLAGVGKIIVIAGTSNSAKLQAMGATHFIDRHSSSAEMVKQIHAITGPENATQVYSCAPLDVDLVIGLLPKDKPSTLKTLLPFEGDEEEQLGASLPLCKFAFVHDLTNASLAPNAAQFWAKVPEYLRTEKLLPADFQVVHGLDDVSGINNALDQYRDFSRAGAQTVVLI